MTCTYASDLADLQFLAQGQQLVQVYTVTIADGRGGTGDAGRHCHDRGINDAAVI